MKNFIQAAVLALATAAEVQPKANDSPQDVYVARFDDNLTGKIKFTGLHNGSIEVEIIDLCGFPESGGPFQYHVHEAPVPSDGNCTGTLGHLNPYNGDSEADQKNELEVGDLSGRYGFLPGDTGYLCYVDQYLSLNPYSPAFIGGLSVTAHYYNTTRYACANITEVDRHHHIPSMNTNNSTETGTSGSSRNMPCMLLVAAVVMSFFI